MQLVDGQPGGLSDAETAAVPDAAEQLEARIGAGDPVVMLFTARWCPAGTLIAAELDDAAVPVDVIDIDDLPHVADRWLVVSLPTLVVVASGRERGRLLGAFGRAEATTLISRAAGRADRAEMDDVPARRRRR